MLTPGEAGGATGVLSLENLRLGNKKVLHTSKGLPHDKRCIKGEGVDREIDLINTEIKGSYLPITPAKGLNRFDFGWKAMKEDLKIPFNSKTMIPRTWNQGKQSLWKK